MAPRAPVFSVAFFLLLLLVATAGQMMTVKTTKVVVPDNICTALSQKFRGLCIVGRNCANVCETEGFDSGHCAGFRHRCFCTKAC